MPAATVRASWYGGATAEPAGVTAETGINLDRSDIQAGQEPLPIPLTSPHTVYGAVKQVALEVTAIPTPATTMSNATIRASGTMPGGTAWFYAANNTYLAQLSSTTTFAADVAAGSPSVSSVGAFSVNDLVQLESGSSGEVRKVIAVGGSGPYTLSLDRNTSNNHLTGAQIAKFVSGAPADVNTEASGQPTTPAGYTLPTTSAVQYDAMGVSTGTAGRKSQFVRLIGALCGAFGTSPGIVTMPSAILAYDEA